MPTNGIIAIIAPDAEPVAAESVKVPPQPELWGCLGYSAKLLWCGTATMWPSEDRARQHAAWLLEGGHAAACRVFRLPGDEPEFARQLRESVELLAHSHDGIDQPRRTEQATIERLKLNPPGCEQIESERP